jgi:hypothetical protein
MQVKIPVALLVLAVALLAATERSNAQAAHLVSTPALGDALPLTETPDGVHLKFPVLLNDRTVVDPADTLRLVYVDPNAGLHAKGGGEGHEDGVKPHKFKGPNNGMGAPADDKFPEWDDSPSAKKISSEAGAESWEEAQFFRDAMNQAVDVGTMLVYATPGKAKPGLAEIDLPDGMLLGGPGGRVVVLAVTSDSEALQAGLQPQDELRSVNGQPVPTDLHGFAHFYRQATDQAHTGGQSYSLEVWRPGEGKTVTLQVGAPPSIPKMF